MVDVKDDSLYTAWVGSNFELEGKKAAAYLDAYMKAKNMKDMKLVNIQGTIGASAQIGRTKGLDDAVAANGWNLLDKTTGEFTQAKGQEVMQSFLKKYKKTSMLYTVRTITKHLVQLMQSKQQVMKLVQTKT